MSELTREQIERIKKNGLSSWEEKNALCDMALRSLAPPSATGAITPEMAAFLLGESELFNTAFGEELYAGSGKFWWRKNLRAMLAAAPAPAQPVAERDAVIRVLGRILSHGLAEQGSGESKRAGALAQEITNLLGRLVTAPTFAPVEGGDTKEAA